MRNQTVSAKHLKAILLIRAGSKSDEVCKVLRLPPERIRSLEVSCRNASDDVLIWLERTLNANEKLRRLIASLGQPTNQA